MQVIAIIVTILLLIPAAVAGISRGLGDLLEHVDHLSAAFDHAGAFFTEISPLGASLGWLLIGILVLALATWLLAGHFRS